MVGEVFLAFAVGAALAFKMDKSDRVAVTFFGEGAMDEGSFYESINYAAIKKLPVLFICENNLYATESPLSVALMRAMAADNRAARDFMVVQYYFAMASAQPK